MKNLIFLLLILVGSCQLIINEEPAYYDARDEVVGQYQIDEYSESTEQYFSYSVEIFKSCCNSNEVIIYNFYDVGLEVFAYYDGYKLTIPNQFIGDYEIEGTGRFTDDEWSLTYVVHNRYQNPSTDFLYFTGWRIGG